ncbi:MAG: cation transporter [Rhodospirillaceae bacterium]|nr:cation transporter [Rhodospirillaceae bacterium]MBT7957222.1 cation transporter [Rhodospirillaceae bacterium]
MIRKLGLALALFTLWLLLSGIFEPLFISLGIISSLFVAWIAHRMEVADHEGFPIHLGPKAVTYWPWLIWEIIKANIDVALIIIKPKLEISPVLFRSPASQKTEVGQVTYANSITLTPGTITVAVNDGSVDVHALTSGAADEVISGRMDRRACQMEGDT